MRTFGEEERRVKSLLEVGKTFILNNEKFTIIKSDKPTCSSGEPKTDIYVLARNMKNNETTEIKISFKKENADFLENKTNETRAKQLFGENWSQVIVDSTNSIKDSFLSRYLIFKEKNGRTEKGAITLGWKFEIVNKSGGDLSGKMAVTKEQLIDIYAGTNLTDDKKDAVVDGKTIKNSGVANYILMNDSVETTQDVIDSLIDVSKYVDSNPDIYFACKALNYRTIPKKWDGDRPLAVYIDWKVVSGKLNPTFKFNTPLIVKGNQVAKQLIECLKELNIDNTDDINDNNVSGKSYVYET